MKTYTLTFTAQQADVLVRALDLYSRIGIGQFEEVASVYDHGLTLRVEQREKVVGCLMDAKNAAGHPSSGSYGIHNANVHDDFRVAYDIKQVVRRRMDWDRNPVGDLFVDFNVQRQTSQKAPPTIQSTDVPDRVESLEAELAAVKQQAKLLATVADRMTAHEKNQDNMIRDALNRAAIAEAIAKELEAEDVWDDGPLPEDTAIDAAFPTRSQRHDIYQEARRLVGAKRSKSALIALVNWLLHCRETK